MRGAGSRTFQALVAVVLVYKYIVCTSRLAGSPPGRWAGDSLRWFSRGASVGGAKVKLCICAVWGSSGRPEVSVGITTQQRQASARTAQRRALWSRFAAGSSGVR
jgi:hypothetical protein